VNLRLAIWDASADAIIDHQPFGVGTGDGVDVLMKYYKRANFEFAFYNKYHSHNQYLFTLLCLGIPGLATLLLLFGLSFYASIHQKNLLYVMLILLMFFFCFTDIPMVRNKTVVFFMFFLHFFHYTHLAKNMKM
jgi:O-antigen ligase